MLAARKDKVDAYIKYNKLFVNGREYTDGKYEGELKICSWNCNGLTKDTLNYDEFLKIIQGTDIAFLYETWTCESSDIEIDGYTSHNYSRRFQHRNARRYSGGIAIYYKSKLQPDVWKSSSYGLLKCAGRWEGRLHSCDNAVSNFDPDDYVPDTPLRRVTQDTLHNSHGIQLMDLCKATSMRICNERLEISESVTYYSTNDCSLIDYLSRK
ncbi:hypothetical protein MAR_009973, partial [Mya arenaria]